ncbi:MAG: hypothetical protein NTX71_05870 [Candidatus Aureabacteria bacterium]|nr:hypothetical protein [Candidatus Auribacterota bacterium]
MKLIFLAMIMAVAPALSRASDSPEEAYRDAYHVLREAHQAEYKKDNDLAWQRYLEARKLFEAIQRDYPAWHAEGVVAQASACAAGSAKTAPLIVRELDQSIRELKLFSARMDGLKVQKLSALNQADWEHDFVYDRIEKLMGDYVGQRKGAAAAGEEVSAGPPAEDEEFAAALEEAGLAAAEIAPGLDSDNDGLNDEVEVELGTDPNDPDTDNDGFYDGDEVDLGYDPLDASDHPEVDEVEDYDESNVDWEEQEGVTEGGEPVEEEI